MSIPPQCLISGEIGLKKKIAQTLGFLEKQITIRNCVEMAGAISRLRVFLGVGTVSTQCTSSSAGARGGDWVESITNYSNILENESLWAQTYCRLGFICSSSWGRDSSGGHCRYYARH